MIIISEIRPFQSPLIVIYRLVRSITTVFYVVEINLHKKGANATIDYQISYSYFPFYENVFVSIFYKTVFARFSSPMMF